MLEGRYAASAVLLAVLLAGPPVAVAAGPGWLPAATAELEAELVTRYGEAQRDRAARGLKQVAGYWREEDGDRAVFDEFVLANFAGSQAALDTMFERFEAMLEALYGHLHEVNVAFRLQAAQPQVVLAGTFFEDGVALAKAIRQTGFEPDMLAMTVAPSRRDFAQALGPDAEGIMGVVAWFRSGKVPMAYDFSFRYKEKFGYNPSYHAAYGYAAGQVLEAAVRLAGSLDRDKIRAQLRSMKFRSLFGHYRVDANGEQTGKQIYLIQWQNGRRRLIAPENLAESPADFPFRAWSAR